MNQVDFYIDTVFEDTTSFDCGYDVFNAYVKNNASQDSAVIHYIIDADNDKLIAYFSLLASALLYGNHNHHSAISAIELKMFAVDKQYQGIGLSERLLDSVLYTIKGYSIEYVGAKLILLYSIDVNYVEKLYEKAGFRRVDDIFIAYKSIFNDGCIPMFKPL